MKIIPKNDIEIKKFMLLSIDYKDKAYCII